MNLAKATLELDNATLRIKSLCGAQAWQDFINALETYSNQITVAVTEAPPERILVVQGQAQGVRKLLQLLEEVQPRSPTTH